LLAAAAANDLTPNSGSGDDVEEGGGAIATGEGIAEDRGGGGSGGIRGRDGRVEGGEREKTEKKKGERERARKRERERANDRKST